MDDTTTKTPSNWIQVAIEAKEAGDKVKRIEAENKRLAEQAQAQRDLDQKWSDFRESLTAILGRDMANDILTGEPLVDNDFNRMIPCIKKDDFYFKYLSINVVRQGLINGNAVRKFYSFGIYRAKPDNMPEGYPVNVFRELQAEKITTAAELGAAILRINRNYDEIVAAIPEWIAEKERYAEQERIREEEWKQRETASELRRVEHEVEQVRLAAERKAAVQLTFEDRMALNALKMIIDKVEQGIGLSTDELPVWGLVMFTANLDASSNDY